MTVFKKVSPLGKLGIITLIITLSITLSVANVWATPPGNVGYAKHEAACYIFAVGKGATDAEVHATRVRNQLVEASVISYALGYHTGTLDAYGSLDAVTSGNYEKSRKQAATFLYEAYKCTTAVRL